MYMIVPTSSTAEDRFDDCEIAVANLTEPLLTELRAYVDIARGACERSNELWELYFWGYAAEFYSYGLRELLPDGVGDLLDGGNAAFLPALPEFEQSRTECNQTIIRCNKTADGVSFEVVFFCYPKHTSCSITSEAVSIEEIEAAFAEGSRPCPAA